MVQAKSSGKKLPKVALTVSAKGIQICDMSNKQVLDEISIYRSVQCLALWKNIIQLLPFNKLSSIWFIVFENHRTIFKNNRLFWLKFCIFFRISFCSADKNFDKVFAFMARNSVNETMECHAYLCDKPKIVSRTSLLLERIILLWPGYAQVTVGPYEICHFNDWTFYLH